MHSIDVPINTVSFVRDMLRGMEPRIAYKSSCYYTTMMSTEPQLKTILQVEGTMFIK